MFRNCSDTIQDMYDCNSSKKEIKTSVFSLTLDAQEHVLKDTITMISHYQ